ncbi:hypothetical protein BS17DRAFT_545209 [Gyrodon lividus]|nr:hypothetical protein BS17DRAFT_545209 [Gyrodon lividus]
MGARHLPTWEREHDMSLISRLITTENEQVPVCCITMTGAVIIASFLVTRWLYDSWVLYRPCQPPMLPFALKALWFCLLFTGILACSTFSRTIGSSWGQTLYSVFATILQGIFCLGMVYDMNPF